MFPRITLFATLILSLVLLPGCPGAAGLGVWGFLLDGGADLVGLDLQANGDAVPVALSGTNFGGMLTWVRVSDSEILIRIHDESSTWIYYGTFGSDTTMSGAWVKVTGTSAGSGGLWTAVKQ